MCLLLHLAKLLVPVAVDAEAGSASISPAVPGHSGDMDVTGKDLHRLALVPVVFAALPSPAKSHSYYCMPIILSPSHIPTDILCPNGEKWRRCVRIDCQNLQGTAFLTNVNPGSDPKEIRSVGSRLPRDTGVGIERRRSAALVFISRFSNNDPVKNFYASSNGYRTYTSEHQ